MGNQRTQRHETARVLESVSSELICISVLVLLIGTIGSVWTRCSYGSIGSEDDICTMDAWSQEEIDSDVSTYHSCVHWLYIVYI